VHRAEQIRRLVAIGDLNADENVRRLGIGVPVIEFGDAAFSEQGAELAKAAGALGAEKLAHESDVAKLQSDWAKNLAAMRDLADKAQADLAARYERMFPGEGGIDPARRRAIW